MKDMKMVTKLALGFILLDVALIFSLYAGYATAKKVLVVDDPQRYVQSYGIFTVVFFLVVFCIITVISVGLIHSLRKSVGQLSSAANQLAAGKVDIDLKKDGNDEFGELVEDYLQVIKNIRYQADIVSEVADGNLTVNVMPKSGEDLMGVSLKKLVETNRNALTNISDASVQIMTSSSEVASASEALAQGSTEQASAIEEITASINDIAEKTKKNASEADNAADLMNDAIRAVSTGNEQMQEMMTAMADINESSESISKIIKVIDDIAFQTNILALNAAVEAARAGEAGKGFAVVAEEVRSLAAKCSAAAAETAELIEDSIGKVETGSTIANESAKALEAITASVQQSEAIIHGIADSSNYQATAIGQIDQAVEQVSQVVQNNSATSEECAAASVELANQADRMSDLLAVYNLGNQRRESGTSAGYQRKQERNERIISLKDGFGKY